MAKLKRWQPGMVWDQFASAVDRSLRLFFSSKSSVFYVNFSNFQHRILLGYLRVTPFHLHVQSTCESPGPYSGHIYTWKCWANTKVDGLESHLPHQIVNVGVYIHLYTSMIFNVYKPTNITGGGTTLQEHVFIPRREPWCWDEFTGWWFGSFFIFPYIGDN